MIIQLKVKHKTEGWTGILEIGHGLNRMFGSHSVAGTATFFLRQDSENEKGEYVEDPEIDDFDELEILELIK